ncbi:Protein P [Labeo rohita]|uniref:Protein P n=1 Tax=Labeo rohita TaxID=84645 RepID=A0ABQ8N2Y3_LABRO|nr:Protein P [Labeo rohita]
MSRSFQDTGHSCGLPSKVGLISTKFFPSASPCHPVSLRRLRRLPLPPSGMWFNHLARVGLRVNWEKSKLSPVQSISFLSVELNLVNMTAHLSQDTQSVLSCVRAIRFRTAVPLKHFQRLLGHMASSAVVTLLGLMHIKPLQRWLHIRGYPWNKCPDASLTQQMLPRQAGGPYAMEVPTFGSGQACVGPYRQHINHQGGVRSFRMSQLARHLLLWSQHRLKSLCVTHIPGDLNRVANSLSRQISLQGEWRLHPQTVQLIWSRFAQAQVDLFASPESTHCQFWYSLTKAPLVIDALPHSWPRDLRKYAFPPVSLIARTLCRVREDKEQVLLVAQFWPNRTWFSDLVLLSSIPPWRIPLRKDFFLGERHNLAPAPRSLEPPPMVPGRDQDDFRDLPPAVVNTLEGPTEICHLICAILPPMAISANHDLMEGRSVGKHDLIIRFLRGARRLNPSRPNLIPSWGLAVVLQALQQDRFEPLQSVDINALSMKMALLTALTSVKTSTAYTNVDHTTNKTNL